MTPAANALPPRSNSNVSNSSTRPTTTTVPIMPPQEARPLAKPVPFSEARDVSCSSRDNLRRELRTRRMSLTVPEQDFLDQLVVHGNEIEVHLAMEKLQDEDLFFDNQDNDDSNSEDDDREATPPSPRPKLNRQFSQGSQRRLDVLEQRKNSTIHEKMWKAHENGLAVTQTASIKSLVLRRNSSSGGGSVTRGIFRRNDSSFNDRDKKKAPPLFLPSRPRPSYRRTQSLLTTVPKIPGPMPLQRRSSTTSRRKSVTFCGLQDGDGVPPPNPKKSFRRSVSDSLLDTKTPEEESSSSALQRQESNSSIPSIHHAHAVRSDSIGSIASIHHAVPIRSDSMASIASLRPGLPIRSDSTNSIASLHHGHPIRSDSTNSIASLHRGHPIRSDSISSIPSLHHGHPLQAASSVVNEDEDKVLAAQDDRARLLSEYSAGDDIASAWLQQQQQQQRPNSSFSAWPEDVVTIPSTATDTTEPMTDIETTASTKASSTSDFPVSSKPLLMRLASQNIYGGEGIEVTELDDAPMRPTSISLISMDASIRTCSSWDDTSTSRHSDIFRSIRRSLSDEDMSNMFLGTNAQYLMKGTSCQSAAASLEDDSSWDMNDSSAEIQRFDSWNVLKDEYVNGYGGGGTLDFKILGTCADDESAQPHVLSPPLMESLQALLPYSKSGENFFLKYSMVRDGASLHTFLKQARGVQYSILALETVDGEVFGAFTGSAWRKNWNYFGTGESFLWRMRRSRLEKTHDILEQAQLESEIDVYPYTGENKYIQLCTHDRIAVGGGTPSGEKKSEDPSVKPHEWGFGLAIPSDLLQGSSSPCVTYGSPSLSHVHADGSLFEIVNLELWTLTPCMTVEEAEKMELGKLFLDCHKKCY